MPSVTSLTTQYPSEQIGVGADPVRLTWTIGSDHGVQLAHHIQVSADDDAFRTLLASTIVEGDSGSDQVAVLAPGPPLRSREVRWFRVRALVDEDWTDWSRPCRVEIGLLHPDDWAGSAITLPDDPGNDIQSPCPLLRRTFTLNEPAAMGRLYATSLGVHSLFLNGWPVADHHLAPGWSAYHKRLVAVCHDVTNHLRVGTNTLSGELGDGWYRGRLGEGANETRCRYGEQLGLLAQLEILSDSGARNLVVTDENWRVGTGAIRSADIYDGASVDFRREPKGWRSADFDDDTWANAMVVPIDMAAIEPWISAPIRPHKMLEPTVTKVTATMYRVDVGQNIAGHLLITARGRPGDTVTVRHAEVLELNGDLHLRALRSAKATDVFTLADHKETVMEPPFTFHGFRYADITTSADLVEVKAVAISSDLPQRSSFSCSHDGINQLFSNVQWSQRDNFVGLPTDCPQRDERLGWTGDAQVFSDTANTLVDAYQFWQNWYRDLSLEQTEAGVPSVVPNVVVEGEATFGRAGWADVATIGPWSAWEATGNPALLEQQLPSMLRWMSTLLSKRGADGLVGGEFQFGDWCDPDAPADQPWESKTDRDFLANAYFSQSARIAGRVASLLGKHDLADFHDHLATEMAGLTWQRWQDHAVTTQTGCAVAIELGIAPNELRPAIAAKLASLVQKVDGAVTTGFLGTPLVLPALTRYGYVEAAYRMLLRDTMPSWLHQVRMGATTMWERWDAIGPDGQIHHGSMQSAGMTDEANENPHMLSFNHYAYGAVATWIHRRVGGIAPTPSAPGYRHILMAPLPCDAIHWAKASVTTGYGEVQLAWSVEDASFRAMTTLPFGTRATMTLPTTSSSSVIVDGQESDASELQIDHGTHEISVTAPKVVSTAKSS